MENEILIIELMKPMRWILTVDSEKTIQGVYGAKLIRNAAEYAHDRDLVAHWYVGPKPSTGQSINSLLTTACW